VIEVAPVDDSVVGVCVSRGYDQVDGRDAAVALLDLGRIVSVAVDEVDLERDAFAASRLFDELDEFSI
jgi:hypothetical protein